jgi:phosphohistidine phosphatase SixA
MPLLDVKELASGGSRNELLKWLASRTESCLAVVGHEPDLGSLVGSLVVGDSRAVPIPLEKAGACLLRFPERIEQGQGELRWLVYPRLLRKLAR